MPRRKAAGSTAVQHTRSRTGCQTCRRRRIKCDGGTPNCQNCTRKGIQCIHQTTLKWQTEYEHQGLAFGRAGVWSKRGSASTVTPGFELATWTQIPMIQPYHFVHYAPRRIQDERISAIIASGNAVSPPRLERPLQLLPQMSATADASILTYYVEKLCPLTTLDHKKDSPFLSMILPYLPTASSAVLDATLALAARHISKTDIHWNRTAAELELKATNALRIRIANMNSIQIASDPDISIITMMLCLYEIVSQCDGRWVVHLRGARDVARSRRTMAKVSTNGLQAFVDRFFAFQDVIGRTACGEDPVFSHTYWDTGDCSVDSWLGCSPALVSIIYSVTELSRKRLEWLLSDFNSQAAALEARLGELQQVIPGPGDCNLEHSAQVKSLTAKVLLHCALYNAEPSMDLIRQCVAHILTRIKWFVDRGLGAGLLWCLFVAAVELDPADDDYFVEGESSNSMSGRPFVLRALQTLEYTSVSNVGRIRQVIIEVWQARDDSLDNSRIKACFNDWETYVAPRSANISLV